MAAEPRLEIVGEPELVYSWDADRCADDMVPDLPARAIRDARGELSVYVSSKVNYRLTGADFGSLAPDCAPVLTSSLDIDPANVDAQEWLGSPYTLDGDTVYALVHQEYHGDQLGDRWSARRDFADEQGVGEWTYVARTGGGAQPMTWAGDRWTGPAPFCEIRALSAHPGDGCVPARVWTSPVDATVTVAVRAWDQDGGGGDGVVVDVVHEGDAVATATIDNGATDPVYLRAEVAVAVGDQVEVRVKPRGNVSFDSTGIDANIALGEPVCLSGLARVCTYMGITFATSTDAGATFAQDEPPAVVAAPADEYDPEWMHALWQPSNIVAHPTDGHFYALVQSDEHFFGDPQQHAQGTCVIRTDDLADPASWRAWGGEAFDVAFADARTLGDGDRDAHRCAYVSVSRIGALTYGLTYNEALGLFVATGSHGSPRPGFYVSYSADLVTWSSKELILEADQGFTVDSPPYYAYPTIIDHDSPSLSFDTADGDAYLYYSYFTDNDPLVIDMYRVAVEFTDAAADAP